MDTKQVIAGMLKENTGTHFLDSGGDSGRAWQRNQVREFEKEQESTLKFDYDYIAIEHNVFHWLVDRLEFAEDLNAEFHKWAEATEERKDAGWLELMETWLAELGPDEDGDERTPAGIYGEGSPLTVNTYNGEDLLSQVLQFTYFTLGDGETAYVILQIHGGADVRGGYTTPKIFEVCGGSDGTEIFDNARAGISCDGVEKNPNQTEIPGLEREPCDERWYTDDGHSLYSDEHTTQLQDYDRTKEDDEQEWEQGKVHIHADGSLGCPHCGGHLSVGFF